MPIPDMTNSTCQSNADWSTQLTDIVVHIGSRPHDMNYLIVIFSKLQVIKVDKVIILLYLVWCVFLVCSVLCLLHACFDWFQNQIDLVSFPWGGNSYSVASTGGAYHATFTRGGRQRLGRIDVFHWFCSYPINFPGHHYDSIILVLGENMGIWNFVKENDP